MSAGADDDKARRAAEALAGYDTRFGSLERRIDTLEANLNRRMDMLERRIDALEASLNRRIDVLEANWNGKFDLLYWMFGVMIAANLAVLIKLLV